MKTGDGIIKVQDRLIYKIEDINNYIAEYFEFVFKLDCDENGNLWCEKPYNTLDEYFKNDFIFSATQNWESGFNFVDWLNGTCEMGEYYNAIEKPGVFKSIIENSDLMFKIISEIVYYYEITKDETLTFNDLTHEKILCMYVYTYAVNVSDKENGLSNLIKN